MPLIELNMILDCEEEVKEVGFYTPLEYRVLDRKQLLNGIKKEINKKGYLFDSCNYASAMAIHEGYVVASLTMSNKKKRKNKIITDWKEDCLTIH
jgi:hypothetical protein|tara:strand:+ start:2234 stop:2518 length:285 start_codon:yes stop_codon:yes gene_type:complete